MDSEAAKRAGLVGKSSTLRAMVDLSTAGRMSTLLDVGPSRADHITSRAQSFVLRRVAVGIQQSSAPTKLLVGQRAFGIEM